MIFLQEAQGFKSLRTFPGEIVFGNDDYTVAIWLGQPWGAIAAGVVHGRFHVALHVTGFILVASYMPDARKGARQLPAAANHNG